MKFAVYSKKIDHEKLSHFLWEVINGERKYEEGGYGAAVNLAGDLNNRLAAGEFYFDKS